ncbi:hypothetical protein ES288_D03G101200v1 [Gossypium darwinii]|nr:hypothetical protein ES288_D03G101200v1 [Gossypium darwinii]
MLPDSSHLPLVLTWLSSVASVSILSMTTHWSHISNPVRTACRQAIAFTVKSAPSKFILVILSSDGFQHSLLLILPVVSASHYF